MSLLHISSQDDIKDKKPIANLCAEMIEAEEQRLKEREKAKEAAAARKAQKAEQNNEEKTAAQKKTGASSD